MLHTTKFQGSWPSSSGEEDCLKLLLGTSGGDTDYGLSQAPGAAYDGQNIANKGRCSSFLTKYKINTEQIKN